ncbi:MAG: hypothetical protein A2Y78_10410 [Acidobacteria bacterium RBG_13_68_16]|nr:MAG: hypothetical protein A2Y78_10410 [Acidobacteria bacterium RBG_13_68_16]
MERTTDIFAEKRHLGALGERLWRRLALAGTAALLVSVAIAALGAESWRRFFFAYLVNFAFVLSLALGALYFVLLHHLTHSGWSVVVRRVGEALTAALPLLALLFIPVLLGLKELYPWSQTAVAAADHVVHGKAAYLNVPFFVVRWAVYLAAWIVTGRFYFRRSLLQDSSGDTSLTLQMERRAGPAMVLFGITLTFASIDLVMSLDPRWFSTIFGVYYFAGSVVGIYALLTAVLFALQGSGFLRNAVTVEHYHDLGKLLFGFVVFWAYIGFSQYMLIWYANIPEETGWLAHRQENGWGWVGLLLVFGHFLIPFVALLSRAPKRRPRLLAAVAVWMLAMHWVDVYWLVTPAVSPGSPLPRLVDLTLLVALGSLLLAGAAYAVRGRSLVPERDPRLEESLAFENA